MGDANKSAIKRPAEGGEPSTSGEAKTPRNDGTPQCWSEAMLRQAMPLPCFMVSLARLVKAGAVTKISTVAMLSSAFQMCSLTPEVAIQERPKTRNKPDRFLCTIRCRGFVLVRASAAQPERAEENAVFWIWRSLKLYATSSAINTDSLSFQERPASASEGTHSHNPRNDAPGSGVPIFPAANVGLLCILQNFSCNQDPIRCLRDTAKLHGMRGAFVLEKCGTGFICTYKLASVDVILATGTTMSTAKARSATLALKYLGSVVPTLKVKQLVDKYEQEVTKEVLDGTSTSDGETNIPSQTARPTESPAFGLRERVELLVKKYMTTGVLKDLVFSPEFDAKEREIVVSVAEKYGLVGTSVGGPDGKFVIVRHALSARDILKALEISGPTDRFELISSVPQPRGE